MSVENGDFEHGDLTHWSTSVGTNCVAEALEAAKQNGTWGCHLKADAQDDEDWYIVTLSQDIGSVAPGQWLRFSYKVIDSYHSEEGCWFNRISVDLIDNENGANSQNFIYENNIAEGEYITLDIPITITATTTKLVFEITAGYC